MIGDEEVKTGEKLKVDRNISEEQAMANPKASASSNIYDETSILTLAQVKAIMKQRLNGLRDICQMFLDGVINSMNNLPYGIRWICKQIKNLSMVQ